MKTMNKILGIAAIVGALAGLTAGTGKVAYDMGYEKCKDNIAYAQIQKESKDLIEYLLKTHANFRTFSPYFRNQDVFSASPHFMGPLIYNPGLMPNLKESALKDRMESISPWDNGLRFESKFFF